MVCRAVVCVANDCSIAVAAALVAWAGSATLPVVVVAAVPAPPLYRLATSTISITTTTPTAISPRPNLSGPLDCGRPGAYRGSTGLLGPRYFLALVVLFLAISLLVSVCRVEQLYH